MHISKPALCFVNYQARTKGEAVGLILTRRIQRDEYWTRPDRAGSLTKALRNGGSRVGILYYGVRGDIQVRLS